MSCAMSNQLALGKWGLELLIVPTNKHYPYLSSEEKLSPIFPKISLGFSGLSTMRGGGERNEGLGKKEKSELLRTLLFSNNWNLYDKYIHIYRHGVPCFATVWPRIFTEIESNLWMRFLITLFWLLMKSFQKSSEMSIIMYILLSLPWTDVKVPRELLTGQDVPCNIAGFVECALFGRVQVKGHQSLQCPANRTFIYHWVVFQTIGYLQV